MTQEEIEAIVIAEYNYWKAVDNNLAISAVGACANIYSAIKGFRAPWHPKPNEPIPIPPILDASKIPMPRQPGTGILSDAG